MVPAKSRREDGSLAETLHRIGHEQSCQCTRGNGNGEARAHDLLVKVTIASHHIVEASDPLIHTTAALSHHSIGPSRHDQLKEPVFWDLLEPLGILGRDGCPAHPRHLVQVDLSLQCGSPCGTARGEASHRGAAIL